MLGQLLEYSVTARPIAASLDFYRSVGFGELAVGDLLSCPYAAVWDGAVSIGLHDAEFPATTPTFVRTDLKMHTRALRRAGIKLEFSRFGDDDFHQAAFSDPNGLLVVLLEARTFSPATWGSSSITACGKFLELSVATHSIEDSEEFWQTLGLSVVERGEAPQAWVRMSGNGLVLGLHQTANFAPALSFRCSELEARIEYLQAKGQRTQHGAPFAIGQMSAATLHTPHGSPIYMFDKQLDNL